MCFRSWVGLAGGVRSNRGNNCRGKAGLGRLGVSPGLDGLRRPTMADGMGRTVLGVLNGSWSATSTTATPSTTDIFTRMVSPFLMSIVAVVRHSK